MKNTLRLSFFAFSVIALSVTTLFASADPEETVMLYPAHGWLSQDGKFWEVQVQGIVFDSSENSRIRKGLIQTFGKALGLTESDRHSDLFQERAWAFVVDHRRNKEVSVSISGQTFHLKKSQPNGHFDDVIRLSTQESGWVEAEVFLSGKAHAKGKICLVPNRGFSVISDIDDTIKISNVTDRRQVILNSFVRPYEWVSGMGQLYQMWQNQGVVIHYVSASPWQLYKPLVESMEKTGIPLGIFHLQQFRWKDSSFFALFKSPGKYKLQVVEPLLKKYPNRQFILIGDSSQEDPEIYGIIARKNPSQIKKIYIRLLDAGDQSSRYEKAFEGLPRDMWKIFRNPDEIKTYE